jgi:ribosome-binding ATPase YchF (GTP1/OBG family)
MRSSKRMSLHVLYISEALLTLFRRVENLKDMVLYRFGSTGVVQCLSRAAEVLGLVPVFPVRNIHTYASGTGSTAVFRDCVLVKK